MWLERFLIIVPSLEHKFLPYAYGNYRPTWAEITLMASSFGLMVLLYLVFAKAVPIISIWELKAGLHNARGPLATVPVESGAASTIGAGPANNVPLTTETPL